MAEVVIKVDPGGNYENGDVLAAFSDRHIACVHAQRICKPRPGQRNSDRRLRIGSLPFYYMSRVSQYRFERVGATEVDRYEIGTANDPVRFGPADMDVRFFLRRRLRKTDNLIFGPKGQEVWFGGRSDFSEAATRAVWDQIEANTGIRRTVARWQLWPMGRLDIRSHLALRMESFTDAQVRSLVEPQYAVDGNGDFIWRTPEGDRGTSTSENTPPDDRDWSLVKVAKRRRKANWLETLASVGATESEVRDKLQPIGDEIDDTCVDETTIRRRYTSKPQSEQIYDLVTRKAARGK